MCDSGSPSGSTHKFMLYPQTLHYDGVKDVSIFLSLMHDFQKFETCLPNFNKVKVKPCLKIKLNYAYGLCNISGH